VESSYRHDDELRETLRSNLAGFERIAADGSGLRHAAVALAIAGDEEGRASFILTRRSSKLKRHAAQWALPGGRLDPGETVENAALRELVEEIGLTLPGEDVLGILDDYPTRSGFLITPVVVWAPKTPSFVADASEVASVHLVPLDSLDAPGVPRLIDGTEPDRPIIQIPLYGRYVHAPTAAILYQLREAGLHGRSTRVAHFDQPVFAWK
jgi:8-oxo-dGTP pyrophosphatase MutT (NUDIX family)